MKQMALRLRIALWFAGLATGAVTVLFLGLWLGFHRAGGDPNGFVTAGLIAGFGMVGLIAAIWFFFDENVAKPIDRLAADLRFRAHSDVEVSLDHSKTRFLGDLGAAAHALTERIGKSTMRSAEHLAEEAAHLTSERERLTHVLSEIPVAVIMVTEDHRVLLYDGQAAHALEDIRPLGLGQSLFNYVDREQILHALDGLKPRQTVSVTLSTADGTRVFDASIRKLRTGAGYMLTMQCEPDAHAERPLAFDFHAITDIGEGDQQRSAKLDKLTYVVFDTETTGLLPDKDEVVQIGAVRAVGRRLVPGEVFNTLVNPGRPIPATSTRVHGISDDMVVNAPTMEVAGTRFLHFAEGSVMVAHNAPFDMAFMQRHADATGQHLDHPVLDTVLLGAELFGASDALTLDAIAERLGVTIPDTLRHTALGDAEATAAVFLKMLQVFQARGDDTLGALLDIQKAHVRILPDLNS